MGREVEITLKTLRLQHTWRWGIVNFSQRQTVADHSFGVWVIGTMFYDACVLGHNTIERNDFSNYLLLHDLEEVVLGDIPAPAKKALDKLYPGSVRRVAVLLGAPPLNNKFQTHWLDRVRKAADLVEAARFCSRNFGPPEVARGLLEELDNLFRTVPQGDVPMCDWALLEKLCNEIL